MNYTDAIIATYDRATDDDRANGHNWYRDMVRTIADQAQSSSLTVSQCAAIYAANSINTPWVRNIKLATLAIAQNGMSGGTLGMIVRKVNAIIDGHDIETTLTADPANRKIVNFWRNLSGDFDAVTVDRWAHRVATNGERSDVPSGARYSEIAEAYRMAASQRGIDPATMQATTWIVARGKAA